ncbi:MAG TPA: carboxy terminal-processing peptidase [Polyangiaceae bacterium]|nr:carboxy terminal-processing peptidase [Polyangiaceae bacterium]
MQRLLDRLSRYRPLAPRTMLAVGALGLATALSAWGVHGQTREPGPDPTDANLTRLTAEVLGHSQFSHHPLDRQLASRFLDGYLDALDPSHAIFAETDVARFAPYRSTLADATLVRGDTSAAEAVFKVYLERLGERTSYVTHLLATSRFDFEGHDTLSLDRRHAPRPKDRPAAEALWREQLRAEYLDEKLAGTPRDRIVASLEHRYRQELAMMQGFRPSEVLETYLNALAHVYDPHSDYLGHEQMQSFSITMNLSLAGIGATLANSDGYCVVRALVPGGPAARSGSLEPGDRIVSVGEPGKAPVPITDIPLSRAVELIRGPKGTTVVLGIVPASASASAAPHSVSIIRDRVALEDQEAKAYVVDEPERAGGTLRLGVVELPSFYAGTGDEAGARHSASADVAVLLQKLRAEHVHGIVLDLRENGGGSLEEAIRLTGLFLREGPVVQIRGPSGAVEVDRDPDPRVAYDGPLVLLTSRFSASASEILAGALADYGRAVVVGDSSTFGKGTVQTILPLATLMDKNGLSHTYDPGGLKITTAKFYRPSGISTQLRGVASDIVLPSTSDFSDVSEASLGDPLPADSIPPAPYTPLNRVAPYVARLRASSLQRRSSEPTFAELGAIIDALRQNLATKTVSLNEAERRTELKASKQRAEDWDRLTGALAERRPPTYELTVENAGRPGLPPPLAAEPEEHPVKSSAKAGAASDSNEIKPARPGSGGDVILDEAEHVLADYVHLLGAPSTTDVAQGR